MTPLFRIYIAGRYDRRAELRAVAKELEEAGCKITARWLDGSHDNLDPKVCADHDLEDIDAANGILFFAETLEAGYLSGGRHVELGYALGRGKWIWVIGSPENVFHSHSRVHCYPSLRNWRRYMEIG